MNTLLKKSTFIVSALIVASSFISCQKTVSKKEVKSIVVAKKSTSTKENSIKKSSRNPIVFIAGFDKGNESFYANARNYFQEKKYKVIDGQYSLEEIILWLNKNANQNPYGEVHIVNKSNPYKGMNLETIINGEKITEETLRKNITQGKLPKLKDVVNNNTKIVFHASGLVENKELLKTLKDAFCADKLPKVIASPYHTIFGGKFSSHYLAEPFYVFYPTANSPGKVDLSKEIAKKYPEEKDINWYDALNNEEERYVGEAYTTQFSIPIKWELDYHNSDNEMPKFKNQEEIMDWIEINEILNNQLKKLKISVDKFRWNWSIKNSKLTIRGRTTGLCVLKPLIKPYGDLKHVEPDTSNKRLYAMK